MVATIDHAIDFVCPRCRADVDRVDDTYRCRACPAEYPIVLGIPDFRVEPDPWIGLVDDRAKALRLHAATEGLDLARSVEAYWAMTPTTSPADASRFTAYVLDGERRAAEWLDTLPSPLSGDTPSLEIGCASGDLLTICAIRGVPMIGIDVAMRWLVLARKRISLSERQVVVCANGEHLPFRAESFGAVVSVGTLEHCRSAEMVLSEAGRVLQRGGTTHIRTTNRFSALPEPHVGLWGVGLLPRRWADAYVRARGGQGYAHHRPLSARELVRGLRRAGFRRARVTAAPLLPSDRQRLGRLAAVSGLYEWARENPGFSAATRLVAPLLEAHAQRDEQPLEQGEHAVRQPDVLISTGKD
jgi:SAM-dependent methyltransferase